jgi:hypothetical protein
LKSNWFAATLDFTLDAKSRQQGLCVSPSLNINQQEFWCTTLGISGAFGVRENLRKRKPSKQTALRQAGRKRARARRAAEEDVDDDTSSVRTIPASPSDSDETMVYDNA